MEIKEDAALEIQILPNLEYLRLVRNFIKQVVMVKSPEFANRLSELEICVSEALANSISEHCAAENMNPITIRFYFHADHIMTEIVDRGRGFDLASCKSAQADTFNEKGRGLQLMMDLADVCEINPSSNGTRIQMSIYLEKPKKPQNNQSPEQQGRTGAI